MLFSVPKTGKGHEMGGSNVRKGESGFLLCSFCSKYLRSYLLI